MKYAKLYLLIEFPYKSSVSIFFSVKQHFVFDHATECVGSLRLFSIIHVPLLLLLVMVRLFSIYIVIKFDLQKAFWLIGSQVILYKIQYGDIISVDWSVIPD